MYTIGTLWGNDCGRAKRVPTPLTECSLHPQRKIQGKQKFLQQGKTTTWSKEEPVKLSLQLSTQTLKLISSPTGHSSTVNSAKPDT